jgi:hypothetical protein
MLALQVSIQLETLVSKRPNPGIGRPCSEPNLEAFEEMVQLFGGKVPGQLRQQIVDVLHNCLQKSMNQFISMLVDYKHITLTSCLPACAAQMSSKSAEVRAFSWTAATNVSLTKLREFLVNTIHTSSVVDPDPYIFLLPESGSGSMDNQAIKVRKKPCFLLFCDFFMTFYL